MPRHNVAIIGAGIGEQHLAAYRNLPQRYSVKTLCDLDMGRASKVAQNDPTIELTSSLESVVADPAIDIVDICLPPHLHFDACMLAMKHGKHVICEKPLVSSLRDADILARASEECGRELFPVFQYRFGPATAKLNALIQAGLAGRPLVASIETHWDRGTEYYAIEWRGTWKGEQGGAVLGHAIHNHDLLCAVFGPVKRLSAFGATRVNPIEVEDCASISFEMENGALATSSITLGSASNTTRLRFCFENLMAQSGDIPYAPAQGDWTFMAREPVTQDQIDECIAGVTNPLSGFTGLFSAIADRLDGVPSSAVTISDGRRSLELVSAIYHSMRTSQYCTMPLDDSHPLYEGWLPDST